ncbi:porin family protein [Paraburkholderia aspalathi]|nr:porin family protein [Paraburkholderia aspalathi]
MKKFAVASVFVLMATTANSADAIVDNYSAPVIADTFSWTGGYIGVNAGYAGGKFRHPFSVMDTDEDLDVSAANGSARINASGFVGGVQAGFNYQVDQAVFGVETDFQGSAVKGDASLRLSNDEGEAFGVRAGTKVDWFGTTRVRAGFVPTERFMVYATGGVAYGKVKSYADIVDIADGEDLSSSVSKSKTKVGYTVGAGAEYAITSNVTLKSEYLFTDLGKMNLINYTDADLTASADAKVKFHTVRVGVNYKF